MVIVILLETRLFQYFNEKGVLEDYLTTMPYTVEMKCKIQKVLYKML
ncbi:hypothetical protein NARC_130047 [Candidatus Nitrosocosmicus arcticus]|uniref:Uncharacterized protein n=1 Tax=Candidatus Nitrosocosmicus arcticus TaxID=2035267 RepID=A0A557SSZ5_9ARCH|nr:hypothetical protein NARC_130047 [Candidatus Nitrosocosmicus arcticus]